MINTATEENVPALFDAHGRFSELSAFKFEDGTGSWKSCSVLFQGRMMIFGGDSQSNYKSQISEVGSCSLQLVGQLPMEFHEGGCNLFNSVAGVPEILLCFPGDDKAGCHSYDGQNIVRSLSTNHDHGATSVGNYRNNLFVVGDGYEGNKKVEMIQQGQLIQLEDFPYVEFYICWYSFVSFGDSIILFGGQGDGSSLDLAAQYDGSWKHALRMLYPRGGHRSVVNGNSILHIGGFPYYQNFEEWTFNGNNFERTQLNATSDYLAYYPESFLVDADYCS